MRYYICKNKYSYGVFSVEEGEIRKFITLYFAKRFIKKLRKIKYSLSA